MLLELGLIRLLGGRMGYNELGGAGTVMGTEESRNNRLPKRAELDGGFDPKAALAKASAAPPS